MQLTSFEIKTYRSCIKTTLTITNSLMGLIGVNGAGKSNILNAILFFKKIATARFGAFRTSDATNKCQIIAAFKENGKQFWLKCEITYETDERNTDEIQSSKLKWNFKEFTGSTKWLQLPFEVTSFRKQYRIGHKNIYYTYGGGELFELNPVQDNIYPLINKVADFFSSINYYSASQFSDPSKSPVSIELDDNRLIRRVRPTSMAHDQFIYDMYLAHVKNDKRFKRYLSTVNNDGIGLVDEIKFTEVEMPTNSYEVKSGGRIKKIERTRTLVIPQFIIDNYNLSPNQLSEGTFKTLALLFYILTDESKLLLIEEPEVGIHHGLLSSIIELIKSQSKNKQIIISTHSDYVLDHLTPENVILVKKEASKGTIAKSLTKSMSKNDYKVLKQYLEESGNLGEYWREGGFENE